MPQVHHIVVHPTQAELLLITRELDHEPTYFKTFTLRGNTLELISEKTFNQPLNHPIVRKEKLYLATTEECRSRTPAFVELWPWDMTAYEERYPLEYSRLSFTGLAISEDCNLALIDRYFPESENELCGVKVLTFPAMTSIAEITVDAGMSSPVFDSEGKRLAMVFYDQGGCSANVYALTCNSAELLVELAQNQIVTDFERATVAFLPNNELAVWSVENWSFSGTVGVYDIASGKARHVNQSESKKPLKLKIENQNEFSYMIDNTELGLLVHNNQLWVGIIGGVAAINLATGDITRTSLMGAHAVTQIKRCGEKLVAVDLMGKLFVL